jgi:hypothetical protein
MALLQVRDCPDDIYKQIVFVAKKQNRTIAQQVLVLLSKGLGQEQSNIDRRKMLIDKIKNRKIDKKIKEVDAVALIKEDRNR